jgi:hypothetical protein
MTDNTPEPVSGIKISEADASQLPLGHFHLVLVVEPNPDLYALPPGNEEALEMVLDHLVESFDLELDPEVEPEYAEALVEDVDYTRLGWLSYEADDFFMALFEENPLRIYFPVDDDEDLEALQDYLTGAAANHPNWRVAVMGGMYEDDVLRIAGLVNEVGLDTTVLARYCLSNKEFVHPDEIEDLDDEEDDWEEIDDEDWSGEDEEA